MLSVFYIKQAILFLLCIVWSKVSAQCSDPLLYRLDDIRNLIANLTVKQENCMAHIEKQENETATLKAFVQKQESENSELKSIIRNLTEKLEAQEQLKAG